MNIYELQYQCAKNILALAKSAGCGHIGSSLSCVTILTDIFFNRKASQDVFILSKGHAASALYSILNLKGLISKDQLGSFYKDNTYLSAHPPCNGPFPEIRFGTGSLGHGLSLAVGVAMAKLMSGKDEKVFCVLSDGDCQEGSTWEAFMFAAAKKLKNLYVIIDNNSIQGFGRTKDIIELNNLHKQIELFGFDCVVCPDGNDPESLDKAFDQLNKNHDVPKCIVAKTIKGYGVSFMEDTLDWHYLPMNDEQYATGLLDIEKMRVKK